MRSDILTAGPRGRRLLLAYAIAADRARGSHDDSFSTAVFWSAHHLDPHPGVLFGPGADEPPPVVTPEHVARKLSEVALPEVTAAAARSALVEATDAAMYWQEPDGRDVLAATEAVRNGLRRVADHLVGAPPTEWWWTALAVADQWSVGWGDEPVAPEATGAEPTAAGRLCEWRTRTDEAEKRAARDRPEDPTANWSGEWWSTPPVRSSTRMLRDGTPAALWFVEDGLGWERGVARRQVVPEGVRVFEIDGASAWADLCRRGSVEVTAEKRHDWYRATGRAGRWVVPDWRRIAEEFDAVHLGVGGYLAAAGTAIDVEPGVATVLAGWSPDETYWLTDAAAVGDEVRAWMLDNAGEEIAWVEEVP